MQSVEEGEPTMSLMFPRCLPFSREDGSHRKYLQIIQKYREIGSAFQNFDANFGLLDQLIASGTLENISMPFPVHGEEEMLCKDEKLTATSAPTFSPASILSSLCKKLGFTEAIEWATKRETATCDSA